MHCSFECYYWHAGKKKEKRRHTKLSLQQNPIDGLKSNIPYKYARSLWEKLRWEMYLIYSFFIGKSSFQLHEYWNRRLFKFYFVLFILSSSAGANFSTICFHLNTKNEKLILFCREALKFLSYFALISLKSPLTKFNSGHKGKDIQNPSFLKRFGTIWDYILSATLNHFTSRKALYLSLEAGPQTTASLNPRLPEQWVNLPTLTPLPVYATVSLPTNFKISKENRQRNIFKDEFCHLQSFQISVIDST